MAEAQDTIEGLHAAVYDVQTAREEYMEAAVKVVTSLHKAGSASEVMEMEAMIRTLRKEANKEIRRINAELPRHGLGGDDRFSIFSDTTLRSGIRQPSSSVKSAERKNKGDEVVEDAPSSHHTSATEIARREATKKLQQEQIELEHARQKEVRRQAKEEHEAMLQRVAREAKKKQDEFNAQHEETMRSLRRSQEEQAAAENIAEKMKNVRLAEAGGERRRGRRRQGPGWSAHRDLGRSHRPHGS